MVTVIIIVITAAVSLLCFYGGGFDALKFNAYQVWHQKQWYRLFSYGFVHSGWGHLFFNMLTLYFFGGVVEKYFAAAFGSTTGVILYVVLYTTALVDPALFQPSSSHPSSSSRRWASTYI